MRQLKLQVLDEESIEELAAGHHLQLLSNGAAVAEIIPIDSSALVHEVTQREAKRLQAREELLAMLEEGFDLGGFRIEDRDELYRRG